MLKVGEPLGCVRRRDKRPAKRCRDTVFRVGDHGDTLTNVSSSPDTGTLLRLLPAMGGCGQTRSSMVAGEIRLDNRFAIMAVVHRTTLDAQLVCRVNLTYE